MEKNWWGSTTVSAGTAVSLTPNEGKEQGEGEGGGEWEEEEERLMGENAITNRLNQNTLHSKQGTGEASEFFTSLVFATTLLCLGYVLFPKHSFLNACV